MDTTQAEFVVKRGDKLPLIETILKDETGAVVDLTTASDVRFKMRPMGGGTAKVDAAAAKVNDPGADGRVRYVWQTADTDTAGWYEAEWQVTFGATGALTFPNDGYDLIYIGEDV